MPAPCFAPLGHALNSDPVFRLVPPLARLAWLQLAAAMAQARLSVLRLGFSRVLSGSEIAAFAGMAEVEWDAQAPVLLEFGLLTLEEDGAVAVPALAAAKPRQTTDRRAAAARVNGCKGGRPRKRPNPAQREIMLPIEGGRAEADEETQAPSSVSWVSSRVAIAKLSTNSSKVQLAIARTETERVGLAASQAAGLAPQPGGYPIVHKWLAAGATEELILDVIERRMARGAAPTHLGYFGPAILEQMGKSAPAAEAECHGRTRTAIRAAVRRNMAFEDAIQDWQNHHRGPIPHPSWFDDQGRHTPRHGHSIERWTAFEQAVEQWKIDGSRGDRPLPIWFKQTGERLAA